MPVDVVVSCHWGEGSMAGVLGRWAKRVTAEDDGIRIEVRPRRVDWGRGRLGKLWVVYGRDTWDLLAGARRADVLVVATAGLPGYLSALLRPRGRATILVDPLFPAPRWLDRLLRLALRRVSAVVCIRRGDVSTLARRFRVPVHRCRFAPMPAPDLDPTATSDEGYLYAAGDAHRDWETLFAALRQAPVRCIVASASAGGRAPKDGLPPGLELRPPASVGDGRGLMEHARAVVVPFQPTELACGPTLILDALALGKPVIASATNGAVDYIDDGRTGLLYPPGDAFRLAGAIRGVMADDGLATRLGQDGRHAASTVLTAQAFDAVMTETLTRVAGGLAR